MEKTYYKLAAFLCLSMFLFESCRTDHRPKNRAQYAKDDFPLADDTLRKVTLVWDSAERKISHEVYFSEYGRARRYAGDTILLVYHAGSKKNEWDNIILRESTDNGASWSAPRTIVADNQPERYSGFSTPDLLVLQNKWLLLAYTGRGIPDDSTHNNLQVRLSKDRGVTWSKPGIISLGRSWEPGMIQLPDGEIQLFYSNEILSTKKAKGRHEQKVLMMSSRSNGMKWSKPKSVAFTAGRRDGMPVPLVLNDNRGIVFAAEAVENERSPEVIWSSLAANWNYASVGTVENGRRWTSTIDPIWGGAPCMVQLPTGEIILSMQTEGGRKLDRYTEWKKNTVVVMAGNSLARNFNTLTFPYPNLPENEGRYFNSIFLKNDSTLALITTKNYPDSSSALFWKEARIYRRAM